MKYKPIAMCFFVIFKLFVAFLLVCNPHVVNSIEPSANRDLRSSFNTLGSPTFSPTSSYDVLENSFLCDFMLAANVKSLGGSVWDCPTVQTGKCSNTWSGITCSGASVTNFNLQSAGLDGTIPSSLGSLTKLTLLNLGSNSLTGIIPTTLGSLTNLGLLQLSTNSFSAGQNILGFMGSLLKLSKLYLNSNNLVGDLVSLQPLSQLVVLQLGSNSFAGPVPSFLGSFTQLTDLYMGFNR